MRQTLLVGLAGLVGTLAVNVAGCFVAGVLFQPTSERALFGEPWRTAVMVGLLGGFTTFSAYGLQTFGLLREGQVALAAANVAASNVLGLLVVWAGYALARALNN